MGFKKECFEVLSHSFSIFTRRLLFPAIRMTFIGAHFGHHSNTCSSE